MDVVVINKVVYPSYSEWKHVLVKIMRACGTNSVSTVLYSTVQYSTVKYSTVQYSTVQYSTVQYSTVQYSVTAQRKQELQSSSEKDPGHRFPKFEDLVTITKPVRYDNAINMRN